MSSWKAIAALTLAAAGPEATAAAAAAAPEDLAGSIEAELDGRRVVLASLRSDYEIEITGDIANVRLTQTFENPYDKPLNARYLFPLNRRAAVHAMTMQVGNEIISAEIQERRQAQQTFERARAEGKAASLLEQHRPNMFTQSIANLMPGLPVVVEIEYAQLVPKVDAAYELVVPMVVGPRFQPPGAAAAPLTGAQTAGETSGGQPLSGIRATSRWALEALPDFPPTAGVDLPEKIVGDRVHLSIELETPVPLGSVTSDTHALEVLHRSSTQQRIGFAEGSVPDNRDFVLRYTMAGATERAGLLEHWEAGEGGYFSLLIEPPAVVADERVLPREMVFLLDCSGSMAGVPMDASKRFMAGALRTLRPTDNFRIIRFSDAATEFSTRPLPATAANVHRGLRYVAELNGGGGTMMTSGIRQALAGAPPVGAIRNVVFLTDGYIGNEQSVLELVQQLLGDARLYAFGVGAGVNRYLLDELGRVGRGFTRYFDPTRDEESQEAVVAELVARLASPVLTDLAIDWGGLPVSDVVPATLPDLYAGDSIRVTGRFSAPVDGTITISGTGRRHRATLTRHVQLSEAGDRPAVRRIWARTAVAELMHTFVTPLELRPGAMEDQALQTAVTELGLTYGLATRWTAFVAVSRRVYNQDPAAGMNADVALPKVAGVSQLAYTGRAMTGGAAPEPGLLLGLLTALATWLATRPRRRLDFPRPRV